MKSPAWLSVCLLALVGVALLAVPESVRAAPVTDMGALRRQMTTGEITAGTPAGGFITARYDDYGWVSWQTAALKYKPPATPLVVIVGGSAVRECVSEDDALAALIGRLSDTPVKVVTAATMMQRLPGTLAVIDNLPRGSGVVVIGVHHPTFVATLADAEAQLAGTPLLLASPALREVTAATYGDAPPVNILAGLQRHVDTYESRRGIAAFTGRDQAYRRHRYDDRGAHALATKQSMAPRFSQGLGAPGGPFFTAFDFNVALLRRCVTVARDKGYEVLLMQDPIDTAAAGDAFATYEAKYQPQVKRIADSAQAHYVDLNTTAGLVDGDFFDLFHLLGSGREKWTAKLGASLAEIIDDHVTTTAAAVPPRSSSAPGVPANDSAASATQKTASPAAAGNAGGAASSNKGDKAEKRARAKDKVAVTDEGDWPVRQIAVIVLVIVAVVLFLAVLRRRAVVRRRARARARARRRATAPGHRVYGPGNDDGGPVRAVSDTQTTLTLSRADFEATLPR